MIRYNKALFFIGMVVVFQHCSGFHPGRKASRGHHGQEIRSNAGILPYAYDKWWNAYFLIGKEQERSHGGGRAGGTWADFGGKKDRRDRNAKETAIREASEETRFVTGKFALKIRNPMMRVDNDIRIQNASKAYFRERIKGSVWGVNDQYVMYLAHIDFIPAEIFKQAPTAKHYEKIDYEWVPVMPFLQAIAQAKNRFSAYYNGKKMRTNFYDTIQKNYAQILKIVYPWHFQGQHKFSQGPRIMRPMTRP